ncbi:acetyltransferase [Caballeronia catudaia]|uniref:Acetyltransferase n=1 Tax=Caballeronia catudaia TaxID=1777136 RepID=A0A157ZEX0_9BURK|nr:NeuD/PglB/VioB family sugar acetyltransferase [Caballeronia catudaia]SAK44056.1 acetyltransferase [Caballeronia catudaia]
MNPVRIVGAGALGRETLAALRALGEEVQCFLVEPGFAGEPVRGIAVREIAQGAGVARDDARYVLAVGVNDARRRLMQALGEQADYASVVHPAATIGPYVEIEAGAMIIGRVSMTTDIKIGRHALINPGCNISHDCSVGDFASLGPGVSLAGRVTIEEGANLGVGAVVAPGVVVGAWSTVGAGAVVIRNVEPGATVVGVPARPIVRREPQGA